MKKIVLVICLLLLVGCSHQEKYEIVTVDAQQVIDKFENGETFVLYAGQHGCEFCQDYTTTLSHVCDYYKINIYYFNYDEVDQHEDLVNTLINDYLYYLEYTPSTYMIVDGVTKNIYEQKLSYTDVVKHMKFYGIIKESAQ